MGGAISGITGAVSSVIGGVGASKAAKQQQKANDNQQAMLQDQQTYQRQQMQPFVSAGTNALSQLTSIAGQPINRADTLRDYYNSDEYKQMADAARYNVLSSAEATGGLGSSATSNALGSIASDLGQNYLSTMTAQQQDMYNQLMGLTNVGLSAAGQNVNSSQQFASQQSNLLQQEGQIRAGRAALPYQVAASANSSMGNGAASDVNSFTNMFSGFFGGGQTGARF